MLDRLRDFFRREPNLGKILILFLLVYGVMLIFFRSTDRPADSTALEEFRKAEKAWHAQADDRQVLEQYLVEHPGTAFFFNVISVFVMIAFVVGLVIDGSLLFRPQFRRYVLRDGPEVHASWDFGMLFRVILLWVVASLSLSMIMAVGRDFFFPELSFNAIAVFHTTVMDLLMVFLILAVLREKNAHWKDVGFWVRPKEIPREIAYGFVGYMAVLPIFFGVLMLLVFIARLFAYEPPAHPLVEIFLEEEKRAPVLIGYSIFLAAFIGPVIEEIFFRGFCYPIIRKKWGALAGMVITAAVFAFIHQNQFAFWPIFILGMALAYVYEIRNNVIAPMVLHLVHNSLFLGYFFLAKRIISESGSGG